MVKEQRLVVWTVIILIVIGSLCIVGRIRVLGRSGLTHGDSVWRLTYDISFPAVRRGKTYIAIPSNTTHSRVFREAFSHEGIWMDILRSKRTIEREVSVVPVAGYERGRFVGEFDIHIKGDSKPKGPMPKEELSAEDRAHYLRNEKGIQVSSREVWDVINQLKQEQITKTEMLERIFDYCSEKIAHGSQEASSDAVSTLQEGAGNSLGCARTMIALCRVAKIPARLVVGFILEDSPEARTHYWVEVFFKKSWLAYDPENGYSAELPATFLCVRRDCTEVLKTSDAVSYQARYSIRRLLSSPPLAASEDKRPWGIADLTRLPASMQGIIALILLLPIGALITAVFRNIIGVRTFGTFTPSLIALSFVQADWRTGTAVFFAVLSIGIFVRFLVNKLKLLMVARLSIILTLVVLCMTMAVSTLDYFGLTPSASAVLLPMVILTMMVERFIITSEEDGYPEAFRILAGTLAVATCCFFILRVEEIGRLVLTFPEVQLLNVAVLLLIGRYSGYRLSELWRFRDVAKLPDQGT